MITAELERQIAHVQTYYDRDWSRYERDVATASAALVPRLFEEPDEKSPNPREAMVMSTTWNR